MLVKEKMKNKYLLAVTKDLLELKVKNLNFLFPIEGYSVGFQDVFKISEIKTEEAYLYINRTLDKESSSSLKEKLKNLSQNIVGIGFNDLGLISIAKELNLQVKLIYMNNHNTTNKASINDYLEYVDSVLISTDITEEEIKTILTEAKKPLVLPYFGMVEVMCSRRRLLTNFQTEFGLELKNEQVLFENISKNPFHIVENEYGTVFYKDTFLDSRNIEHEKIEFYYINGLNLTKEDIIKIINKEKIEKTESGFLNKKTYYRLKEMNECKK